MSRRVVGMAVVLIWLAAIGWLARRALWQTNAAVLDEAALSLPPGAAYYTISLAGQQVGYASTTVDTLADTLRVSDLLVLELPVLGAARRTEARTDANLSRTLRLRDFTAMVRGEGTRFVARGWVEDDSLFTLEVTGEGEPETRRIRLSEPLLLPQLLPLSLTFGRDLQPGQTFTRRIFDPVLLSDREVALTVAAESTVIVADSAVFDSASGRFTPVNTDTLRVWRFEGTEGGRPVEAWIDQDGLPVLTASPIGLRLERTAFEVAYENFRRLGGGPSGSAPDLVRLTAIRAGVAPPARSPARVRVRLGGQPLAGFALDGDRQRLVGDTLVVTREGPPQLEATYRLPAWRRELIRFVRPEPLVQSDDPRLLAQARQVIGRTSRPQVVAERLVEWVYQNLRKEVTTGLPSALAAYDARRGDCNEHTVLFVALARSVGLPARTAAGLLYLDGAFYYHAWAEVYLQGWVAVDPTFGQFPAGAGHLRFTVGGLARQLELLRVFGRLTIEVLPND